MKGKKTQWLIITNIFPTHITCLSRIGGVSAPWPSHSDIQFSKVPESWKHWPSYTERKRWWNSRQLQLEAQVTSTRIPLVKAINLPKQYVKRVVMNNPLTETDNEYLKQLYRFHTSILLIFLPYNTYEKMLPESREKSS